MKKMHLIMSFLLLYITATGTKPNFSFCCELQGKEFSKLLSDSALIRDLVEMQVSIRVGLHDFSSERTQTIQKLNKAGIPVYAWLLLPEEDGYWFNMHNGDKAQKRYDDFKKWTAENNLIWAGIGIDLEPSMGDAKLAVSHPWKLVWKAYKRLYDNKSLTLGKDIYQNLIDRIKADGYTVESYIIPFIFEERAKKTTSFQKLLGIVDIKTDIEIPMLYTSAAGNPGIIPVYHQKGMPVALGSTGGGVKIEGIELASLSWEKLERDLLIASKLTDQIIIFCLETSVEKGFISKIKKLDFTLKEPDISLETRKQMKINGYVRTILVVLDHPFWFTLVVFIVITGILIGIYRMISFIFILFKKRK